MTGHAMDGENTILFGLEAVPDGFRTTTKAAGAHGGLSTENIL